MSALPAIARSFTRIGATVKYAGNPGVIYLDDHQLAGADAFTGDDIQQFGLLFDNYLYATDTTAFGRESDINGDGRIAILMTPAVNQLTTDCTNGRIVGYTFSNDLIPFAKGSNSREMFYTHYHVARHRQVQGDLAHGRDQRAARDADSRAAAHDLVQSARVVARKLRSGRLDE